MKKLITVISVLVLTTLLSVSALAAETTQDPQPVIETNFSVDTATDTNVAASEVKDDVIKKTDVKSFKGKFTGQFVQLNTLRTEAKNLWTQLKTNNQSIKAAWDTLKTSLKNQDKAEAKKLLTALKTKIDPLRQQVKALHSEVKELRAQKKTEWASFRAAIKARDEAKAATAINNIIELKKQIIEKQKALLPLKQSILEQIK